MPEFKPSNPKFRLCIADKANPDGKMLEVASFWEQESKAGKMYLSGKIKANVELKEGEYLSLFPFVPKKI